MTMGPLKSELFGLHIAPDNKSDIELEPQWENLYVFVLNGCLQIEINHETLILEEGKLLVIHQSSQVLFPTYSKEGCQIAVTKTT